MLKKFILALLEKSKILPVVKKGMQGVVTSAGVVEIIDSCIIISDTKISFSKRIKAGAKASCCTVALVSGYSSKFTKTPSLITAFRLCCYITCIGYSLLGGDLGLALGLSSLALKRNFTNPSGPNQIPPPTL